MTPKKPVNGKADVPLVPPKQPKPRGLQIDLKMEPSIELLNSVALFRREIKFAWLRLRGEVTQAGFPDGRIAEWFDATDLRTFARTQDILFRATDVLIATPPRNQITQVWEPIAQLIRNIAKRDAKEMEHPLKDEFRYIIRSTWEKAGGRGVASADNPDALYAMLLESLTTGRDPKAIHPPRTAVWAGGDGELAPHYCFIHLEVFSDWLSTPHAKHRPYPMPVVRKALVMLDFEEFRMRKSKDGKQLSVRLWKGPIELLEDQTGLPNTPIC